MVFHCLGLKFARVLLFSHFLSFNIHVTIELVVRSNAVTLLNLILMVDAILELSNFSLCRIMIRAEIASSIQSS